MNYTEPKVIYTCFPGGKHKVLTMSYDDGRLEDRRLVELFNRYGIHLPQPAGPDRPAGAGRPYAA